MLVLHHIYCFLKDQGSFVAGLLALTAGLLAYRAGRRQALAAEKQVTTAHTQIQEYKRAERRKLAREGLVAARVMVGIVRTIEANQDRSGSNTEPVPFADIQGALGGMTADFICSYAHLYSEVARFRSGAIPSEETGKFRQSVKSIIAFLLTEAEKTAAACDSVLAADDETYSFRATETLDAVGCA